MFVDKVYPCSEQSTVTHNNPSYEAKKTTSVSANSNILQIELLMIKDVVLIFIKIYNKKEK